MMSIFRISIFVLFLAAGLIPALAQPVPRVAADELHQRPAVKLQGAVRAVMLSATTAGKRIVAVGDHGVVLLSDDGGAHFRQATEVPSRVALTSVWFSDERNGWAAGHWGVILRTTDAGETWMIQRSDTSVDQPLFAIRFLDERRGIAVGLWSLMLATEDGGAHWKTIMLPPPSGAAKADRNLYQILVDAEGVIVVGGEQGIVYRSMDAARSWAAIPTGARGTYWSGTVLADGSMLLGGLAGILYRSSDAGQSWSAVDSGVSSSIVALAQLPSGTVVGAALDGVSIHSTDRGRTFTHRQRDDRLSYTAMAVSFVGKEVLFSKTGPTDEQ